MEFDVSLNASNILVLALIVDAITGEPAWIYSRIPHPIVWMAKFLDIGEKHLNKADWQANSRKLGGLALILIGVTLVGFLGWIIEKHLEETLWGSFILVVLTSIFLAGRSLFDHVHDVERALKIDGNLDAGRDAVGMIVGRHTASLDEAGVSRAAIESLAENFSDGVVAPAFWFFIGGLPGILIYKLVNTADSMIGNRSERFEAFGWAAARLDDVMNIIPARLTALLIIIAALPFGQGGDAIKAAWRDARKHLSPNAGWPEAAMAGALGIKLGGPRKYPGDVIVEGVWLGHDGKTTPLDILRALKHTTICWGLMLLTIAASNLQF